MLTIGKLFARMTSLVPVSYTHLMSFNDIKDMPLLAYDGTIARARELNIQYIEYNEDAKILCEKAWCPKTYVMLSQKYTDDFSQDMRCLLYTSRCV